MTDPRDTATRERDDGFVWRAPGAGPEGPWTAPEAFLVIVMLAAACDRGMGRLESEVLQLLTHRWYETGVVREKDLHALNLACVARLGRGEAVLGEACAALPVRARAAAYAHALDIMACDRVLRPEEAAFAERLAAALDLSASDVERIGAVIALKNAY